MEDKSVSTHTHYEFLDIKEEHCNDTVHNNFELSIKLEPLDEEVHIKEEDVPIENISEETKLKVKAKPGLSAENLLKCEKCDERFVLKTHYSRHLLEHFEKSTYECVICEEKFDLQTMLNVHLMTHTGNKPFTCSLCEKTFRERCNLYRHLIAHCPPTGEKEHYCAKCYRNFPSHAHLREHLVIHTGIQVYHKCYVCNIQFIQRGKMKQHLLTHDQCYVCHRRFPGPEELEWHMDVHVKKLQNNHGKVPYVSDGRASYIIAQDLEAIKNQSIGNLDNYLQDSDTAVIKDEFDS